MREFSNFEIKAVYREFENSHFVSINDQLARMYVGLYVHNSVDKLL